jgi:hypothetical protein
VVENDAVVLGTGDTTVSFDDPSPGGESVRVTLHLGSSVSAQTRVDLHDPHEISDYLAELDRNWRGWPGDLSWGDGDLQFSISARHDGVREVTIHVHMQSVWNVDDPERPNWRASGWVYVEPAAIPRAEAALRVMMESAASGDIAAP